MSSRSGYREKIPIKFEYQSKFYDGHLQPVSGSGYQSVWHVILNNYYHGELRYTDRWIYTGNSMEDLGDYFANYITAWVG